MSVIGFLTMLLTSSAMENPAAPENMSYFYLLYVGEFLRYPCIKFIGHTMSFIGFLTMLLNSSAIENPAAPRKYILFLFVVGRRVSLLSLHQVYWIHHVFHLVRNHVTQL